MNVNANHGPRASGRRRSAEQRRSPRYPANWLARYRLDPGDPWRACRVVDVSLEGFALELRGATLVEGIVGPIELQIASVAGEYVGVTLRAVIRHHLQRDAGRILTGVEFGLLRSEERTLLHSVVEVARDRRAATRSATSEARRAQGRR